MVRASADVGDGSLLVALDTTVIRVDTQSGSIRWRRGIGGGRVALAASNGRAFAALDHDLYRVDLETGNLTRVLSVLPACGEGCATGIEWLTPVGDRLMITGDFSSPGQNFLVIDANSGTLVRTTHPDGINAIRRGLAVGSAST